MLLDSFIKRLAPLAEKSDPSNRQVIFMPRTNSGIFVNEDTALKYSAVWAAVQLLSRTVGSLPWCHMRHLQGGGKEKITDSPTARILGKQPNPDIRPFTFKETLIAHATMWGNGYAEIEKSKAGIVKAMWIITPDRVMVARSSNGDVVYEIDNFHGQNTVLRAKDMFHLKGLGFDGLMGYSVIGMAAQSIGLGLATESYGSSFFGNSSIPSGILTHPGKLSEPAKENLGNSWDDIHQGVNKARKVAVLEEGLTFQAIGIPPEDAQFLETRKFQITEFGRWFGVPPHMIGDMEKSSFNNIEQQSIDFVRGSIVPWAIRLEQEADIKLLGSNRAGGMFTKLNLNGLLRGDTASRFNAYSIGRQGGWLSVNDIREFEDMNPLPGEDGDIYLVPLAMTTPERFLKDAEAEPEPVPEQLPQGEPEEDADDDEQENGEELSPVKSAYRHLLVECMERVLRRETHRVVDINWRFGDNKDRFFSELGKFYLQHGGYMKNELTAVIRSLLATCVGDRDGRTQNSIIDMSIDFYIQGHADRSRCDIMAAYDSGDVTQWTDKLRAGESADYLIDKVIDAGLLAECMK